MSGTTMKRLLLMAIAVFLLPAFLFAGNTGKITGVVKDKETGDALPGVNVILEGTTMGAATNARGEYTILNVPAGVYTVTTSMISYAKLTKQNVRVIPDFTTRLDFDLVPTVVSADEVVVIAERPLIQKDQTMTMSVTSSEEIKNLPVRGFQAAANLGVGIVVNNTRSLDGGTANVNIRGGRPNETGVYMDGFQQNNLLTGISSANVPQTSIEEVQVITGGFDAEYGRNQSGIIHVTTKSGSQKYSGSVEFVKDPGGLLIAEDYNYNVLSAGIGGPVIPGSNKIRFFVSGEARNIEDAEPSVWGHPVYSLSDEGDRNPDPTALDTVIWAYDGNNVKFKKGPRPTQFSDAGINSDRGYDLQSKLTFDVIANTLRLDLTGNYSRIWRRSFVMDRTFSPDDNLRREITNLNVGATATYTLSPTSFVDFGVNVFSNTRKLFNDRLGFDVSTYNDHTRGATGARTYYGDNLIHDIGRGTLTFRRDDDDYFSFKGNYVNQIDKHNQIKAGFDYFYHTIRFLNILDIGFPVGGANNNIGYVGSDDGSGNVSYKTVNSDDLNNGVLGPAHPYSFAFYLQDKMEYEGLVLRGGIRYDLFNPGVKRVKDLSYPTRFGTDQVLDAADYESAKNDNKISPRFSVSFPVSEKTQFRMSYGKFFQQPNLQDLYVSPDFLERVSIAPPFATTVGNPNLEAERSTQYEVGLRRALSEKAAIDINAYYKDIQGLVNSRAIQSFPNGIILTDNADEGVIQGLNVAFELRRVGKVSGRLAYTLQSAKGSGSGENSGFRAAWLGFSDAKFNAPLNFDQRHTINGVLDIRNAKNEGPTLGGMKPLENAGINFIVSAGSGLPYTPTEVSKIAVAGVPSARVTARRNSQNQPWTFRVDMKADKTVYFANSMNVNVYVQVLNLLDRKNVINVFSGSGRPDDDGFNLNALNAREYDQYYVLLHDGLNWDTPRQARLGVIFNF